MLIPNEAQAKNQTIEFLSEILECDPSSATIMYHRDLAYRAVNDRIDASIEVCGIRFVVEYKRSGSAAIVAEGMRELCGRMEVPEDAVQLFVVPFMGEAGRMRCHEARIAWIDLSGNAHIFTSGIRVHIEGHPNQASGPADRPILSLR